MADYIMLNINDLKFDENGDAIKNYVAIKTFQDGEIIFSDAYTG